MGSAPIAIPTLRYLASAHELRAVVTQPDKPTGRKRVLTPTAVKAEAQALGIPVYEPLRLKDPAFLDLLKSWDPEVIVVLAYGRLVPSAVLDLPPHGCINIHGSILPAYRGPCPIERAIADGCASSGLTTFYMAQGFDTGDVIFTDPMDLSPGETARSLRERMALAAVPLIERTLRALADGTAPRIPQDHAKATHAPVITREASCIDWSWPAERIECLIRACEPEPGAFTWFRGAPLKVRQARVVEAPAEAALGAIFLADRHGPCVAAGGGRGLLLVEVQPAGKSWMQGGQMVSGYRIQVGETCAAPELAPATSAG